MYYIYNPQATLEIDKGDELALFPRPIIGCYHQKV